MTASTGHSDPITVFTVSHILKLTCQHSADYEESSDAPIRVSALA